jgi:hypothetical protein
MNRWLVTGFPRSRTAWFATVCRGLHEPVSREGYGWLLANGWPVGQGIADSGAALILPDILRDFAPLTLIVDRPMHEVVQSAERFFAPETINQSALVDLMCAVSRSLSSVSSPLIKRVQFDRLRDIGVMTECLDWLGVRVDNLDQAMRMNIQSDARWNLAEARKRVA